MVFPQPGRLQTAGPGSPGSTWPPAGGSLVMRLPSWGTMVFFSFLIGGEMKREAGMEE
jgi:hypothetical protein